MDVCEELFKFTLVTRDASSYLTDRYSERKEEALKAGGVREPQVGGLILFRQLPKQSLTRRRV